jgi:hypothetical protein
MEEGSILKKRELTNEGDQEVDKSMKKKLKILE